MNHVVAVSLAAVLTVSACGESDSGPNSQPPGSGELTLPDDTRNHLLGLELEEFEDRAESLGFTTRVVRQDGQPLDVTADFDPGRIDVAVDDNTVTDIIFPD